MFADSFCGSSPLGRSRRGWTTLASFGLQGFALAAILTIPLFYTEALHISQIRDLILSPPPTLASAPAATHASSGHALETNLVDGRTITPRRIPIHAQTIQYPESAPDVSFADWSKDRFRDDRAGELTSLSRAFSHAGPLPSPPKMPSLPARLTSHWMEGNLIRRVQPTYPIPAKAAGIQGTVLLKAIIGRDGKIEKVQVLTGHPLLVKAAVDAVSQWLYRPYLLNDQAVEVETEVTVNFILGR